MSKRIKAVVSFVIVLSLAVGVIAISFQSLTNAVNISTTAPEPGKNIVSVQGEGIVRVVPDTAFVTLGIETSNKDMSVAQTNNKQTMNAIINELTGLGIKKEDIQTQNYNVYPDYRWENDKNILVGYKVSNQVRVKIENIDNTGKILDAVAAKGSNVVHGIQFTVSDENAVYHEALQIALKNAEDKAKAMVGYFGITKLSPITIAEGTQNITYPPMDLRRATTEMMDEATPISPGEMEIRAQVSVSFQY